MATIKAKIAFKETLKNGGNIKEAMIKAKYAPTTVKNSENLTNSKGWLQLVEEKLSDSVLLKVHKEGLKATTKKPHMIDRDDKGRPIYEYTDEVDHPTRHRFLETAYKLKHRYGEGTDGTKVGIFILGDILNLIKENEKTVRPDSHRGDPIGPTE